MRRIAIILILLAGCQPRPQPAPPLKPSAVTTFTTHYVGSVISGPTTAPASALSNPLIARVRWVALAKMPDAQSASLGSRSRLIVAGNTDAPLLGSPSLTGAARIVDDSAAASLVNMFRDPPSPSQAVIAESSAALLHGLTTVFTADAGDGTTTRQMVELRLTQSGAAMPASMPTSKPGPISIQCALTVGRRDPFAPSSAPPAQSETAFFDLLTDLSHGSTVLLLPMTFADVNSKVLAASIEVRSPVDQAEADAAIDRSSEDLKKSSEAMTDQSVVSPIEISQSAGISRALRAMRLPDQQRSSLIYIAAQMNAPLCQDVALVADNSILLQLSQKVLAGTANLPGSAPPALGWVLDRSSFELLTSLADAPGGNKLPAELSTVLTQFAGEAARHSAALDEIAHGMSSQADLHNRIIAQNLVFLTDSSPAARVRAFDWLSARHLAPASYDPLGPARERRIAIDKAATQP